MNGLLLLLTAVAATPTLASRVIYQNGVLTPIVLPSNQTADTDCSDSSKYRRCGKDGTLLVEYMEDAGSYCHMICAEGCSCEFNATESVSAGQTISVEYGAQAVVNFIGSGAGSNYNSRSLLLCEIFSSFLFPYNLTLFLLSFLTQCKVESAGEVDVHCGFLLGHATLKSGMCSNIKIDGERKNGPYAVRVYCEGKGSCQLPACSGNVKIVSCAGPDGSGIDNTCALIGNHCTRDQRPRL